MPGSKKGKMFVMNMTLEADPDNPSETKVILKHGWNHQVLPGNEKKEGAKKRKIKELLESSEESEADTDESDGESSTVSDSEYWVKSDLPKARQSTGGQAPRTPYIRYEFEKMKNNYLFPDKWKDLMAPLMHRISFAKCGICNKKLRNTQNARKHYHSRLHIRNHMEAIDRDCVTEENKISKFKGKELRSLPEYIPVSQNKIPKPEKQSTI